jgi:hypothetical protein
MLRYNYFILDTFHPGTPHERVARLYTQAPGFLFVITYDSQGYSRGISTRLHTGHIYLACILYIQPINV